MQRGCLQMAVGVQLCLDVVFVHKLLDLLGKGPDVKGGVEALDVLEQIRDPSGRQLRVHFRRANCVNGDRGHGVGPLMVPLLLL